MDSERFRVEPGLSGHALHYSNFERERPATRPQRVRAPDFEVCGLLVEDPDRAEEVAAPVEFAMDVVVGPVEIRRSEEVVGLEKALDVAAAPVINEVDGEVRGGCVAEPRVGEAVERPLEHRCILGSGSPYLGGEVLRHGRDEEHGAGRA